MASIINSFRNISSDKFWLIKIIVFAVPVFMILQVNILSGYSFRDQVIMCLILGIFYIGISTFLMNRNINNRSPIMPSLIHIIDYFKFTIFGSLISLPVYILLILSLYRVYSTLTLEPFVMWVIYISIILFFSPFIFVPLVMYSAHGRLKDAVNIQVFFDAAGNFVVAFASYIIQYAFTILLLWYLLHRLFLEMMDDNLFINVVSSIFVIITILSIYSYCSDLYGDVIPEIVIKKKSRKQIV